MYTQGSSVTSRTRTLINADAVSELNTAILEQQKHVVKVTVTFDVMRFFFVDAYLHFFEFLRFWHFSLHMALKKYNLFVFNYSWQS